MCKDTSKYYVNCNDIDNGSNGVLSLSISLELKRWSTWLTVRSWFLKVVVFPDTTSLHGLPQNLPTNLNQTSHALYTPVFFPTKPQSQMIPTKLELEQFEVKNSKLAENWCQRVKVRFQTELSNKIQKIAKRYAPTDTE